MEVFIKISAGILVSIILCLTLGHVGKEFSFLLTLAVCCMVACVAITFLSPIYDFIEELITLGNFDRELLGIVLKSVAIGLLTEVTSLICADAGNASLGKILQVLSSVLILWMSLPLFTSLIALAEEILSEL